MPRRLPPVVALLLAFAPSARADDGLPAEVVEAVKKATVFVRVEGDGWAASGSGFVVAGDDKAVLVATNDHVITADSPARPGKPPALTVVFDSGTPTERSYPAAVAAADPERDLAVLRVVGMKSVPRPIPLTDAPKLTETMPVYSFGFPFGKALAADSKSSPAVTVGKASVSSLRRGSDGELATIQIDGNLNPGNSGGPVVDVKGRLVGVAVATLRDGQGIGFTVPAGELGQMLRGRVGKIRVQTRKKDDKTTARIEVSLIDPAGRLRAASARYLVVPPRAKRPDGEALDRQPGSKAVELKADKGVWAAEVAVPAAEGDLLVQVSVEPTGKPAAANRVRAFPLAPKGVALAGPPPAGWKEYAPRDRSFVMWVPEKPASQSDRERTLTVNGQRIRVNTLAGRTADGLTYEGQSVQLPIAFMRIGRKEVYDLFRGAVASELNGRVTDTKEVEFGPLPGVEYGIEAGRLTARVRLCVSLSRVYLVQVVGSAEQTSSGEAETLLNAFRPPFAADVAAKGLGGGPGMTAPAVTVKGNEPPILGGAFDPTFTETAPPGGLLVGFEVGVAPAFGRTMTRSIRPIYRVGAKESFGEQRGTQLKSVTTLKAKAGYAVGSVAVMHGLGFDGLSVTFMKVAGDKLDPNDSYESEYVGSDENKSLTRIGGDGTPVVGIVGKTNAKDLTGFGLLLKGQEPPAPKK